MNNKGQIAIGGLIILAITVIVGAILLQGAAQNVGTVVNTYDIANQSISTVVNGTAQYITNCRALSSVVLYNETNDVLVGSGNYTITNNVVNNGALAVQILPEATAAYKSAWQVSGTCQPLTYDDNAGSRTMSSLVILMMAMAVASVAIAYVVKNYQDY